MSLHSRAARATALLLTVGLAPAVVGAMPALAADPVDGALTSGDSLFPRVGNGGYDVDHYDLDLAWTPAAVQTGTVLAGTIDATAAVSATTTGGPLRSFGLDFEGPGLVVTSVTVDGEPAAYSRSEDPAAISHKLVVTPAAPVAGTFTTVVAYEGTPNAHRDADGSFEGWNATTDGATFVNQPVGAMTGFPSNNTPADKATYTIDVDIPTTITGVGVSAGPGPAAAASNGELVGREPSADGTRTTWRWEQQEPMATELAMISIGKYDVITSQVALADGRTLPEWSFVDASLPAATKTAIEVQRARWKSVLDGLAEIYGDYPGNSVGVVVDRVPSQINYALETQDRSFFPGSVAAGTFVHEAAHQWFGNHVAPTDWNDLWLNEGMASWAPTYFNAVLADPPGTGSVEATYWNSWRTTAEDSPNWSIAPAGMTDSADLYGWHTYQRGAQMWEALRLAIGDRAFFDLTRTWQERYAGQSRGREDFYDLAEEVSGRDLDAFFDDWVREPGKPAWTERFELSLVEDAPTDPAAPGDVVTYTLQAHNPGYQPVTTGVATLDLADVLDDATLVGDLPAGLSADGDVVTWQLPRVARGRRAQVELAVRVAERSSDAVLRAVAAPSTLGGVCTSAQGCTSRLSVPVQPLSAGAPTVTGSPRVGAPLRARPGSWPAGTSFAYQWSVAGSPVAGASGASYTPRAADRGREVTVAVTGLLEGYAPTERVSEPTAVVASGRYARTPRPTVGGRPAVGRTLRAWPGRWERGTRIEYRWLVGQRLVAGERGRTFRPSPWHRGRPVRVRTVVTKPGYPRVVRTSVGTARVR